MKRRRWSLIMVLLVLLTACSTGLRLQAENAADTALDDGEETVEKKAEAGENVPETESVPHGEQPQGKDEASVDSGEDGEIANPSVDIAGNAPDSVDSVGDSNPSDSQTLETFPSVESAPSDTNPPEVAFPPDIVETEPDEDQEPALPLSGRIICLDPGHCVTELAGKGYTGPVSPLSNEQKPLYTEGTHGKNMTEERLNLIVGLKLRDVLEALGAEVLMTREVSEITITGIERCEVANKGHADVNIHIHADGVDDPRPHGVSVLVPAGDLLGTPDILPESIRLGQLMVDCVAEATGAYNRGIVPRSDMSGFNFSEVPSVLIEMGFMTNPEEDALLETDEYQNQIVEGMKESLLQWYGIEE